MQTAKRFYPDRSNHCFGYCGFDYGSSIQFSRGAQKSQRDSQRRTDLGYLVSQLEQYAGNNNGDYPDPGDLSNFTANYIDNNDKSFRDPVAGEHYVLEENTTLESQESPSGLCGGGEDLTESGYQPVYYNRLSRRSFVVEICLESGNYVQTNK